LLKRPFLLDISPYWHIVTSSFYISNFLPHSNKVNHDTSPQIVHIPLLTEKSFLLGEKTVITIPGMGLTPMVPDIAHDPMAIGLFGAIGAKLTI
jgi:hypothetical protein